MSSRSPARPRAVGRPRARASAGSLGSAAQRAGRAGHARAGAPDRLSRRAPRTRGAAATPTPAAPARVTPQARGGERGARRRALERAPPGGWGRGDGGGCLRLRLGGGGSLA